MMMRGIRFIPEDCNINFIGMRWAAFIISTVLVVASIFVMFENGLNMGIDFTGGTVVEISTPVTPDLEVMRSKLNNLGFGSVSIQEFGSEKDLLIRLSEQVAPEGWKPPSE